MFTSEGFIRAENGKGKELYIDALAVETIETYTPNEAYAVVTTKSGKELLVKGNPKEFMNQVDKEIIKYNEAIHDKIIDKIESRLHNIEKSIDVLET